MMMVMRHNMIDWASHLDLRMSFVEQVLLRRTPRGNGIWFDFMHRVIAFVRRARRTFPSKVLSDGAWRHLRPFAVLGRRRLRNKFMIRSDVTNSLCRVTNRLTPEPWSASRERAIAALILGVPIHVPHERVLVLHVGGQDRILVVGLSAVTFVASRN